MSVGSSMLRYDHLLCERRGNVAYLTIDPHDLLDSADRLLRVEVHLAFSELRADEKVLVVILTGMNDEAFVQTNLQLEPRTLSASTARAQMRTLLDLIVKLGKPIVLAIDGLSSGYCCEIAMACTCRIATDTALFDLSGLEEWPIRYETLSACDAHGLGLVDEIVPPTELRERTEAIAREIVASPPIAERYAREATHRCLGKRLAKTDAALWRTGWREPHLS